MKAIGVMVCACIALIAGEAQARIRGIPVPGNLLKSASVVAVVEVLDTDEPKPSEILRLVKCKAKLQVLRAFAEPPQGPLHPGDVLTLAYEIWPIMLDRHLYASFSKGAVYFVPLAGPTDGEWRLASALNDLDDGEKVVPCRREPPPNGLTVKTKEEFAAAEFAATLALGTYEQATRAARVRARVAPAVAVLTPEETLTRTLQTMSLTSNQWYQVGVALYGASASCMPTIARLTGAPQTKKIGGEVNKLVALAFHTEDPAKRDEWIIRTVIENLPVNLSGAEAILGWNFASDPLTRELLAERLKEHAPGALTVACAVAFNTDKPAKGHPLLPAALDCAMAALRSEPRIPVAGADEQAFAQFSDFEVACPLIRINGSDAQFDALVQEFAKACKSNRLKCRMMWEGAMSFDDKRVISLVRIAIDDEDAYGNVRLCDSAAWLLQKVTHKDFGADPNDKDRSHWDSAIHKARQWLIEHERE
jgi:hypothetical protein